ncbi:MAG: hypothetical protein IBX50_20580, partial [Marinospirillum sp.]|nr:hypothetical protein [Marinospirillum sp.]
SRLYPRPIGRGFTRILLKITTRACLVNYLLKSLQVHRHIVESDPQAQQLVLVNKSDIQEWLFG